MKCPSCGISFHEEWVPWYFDAGSAGNLKHIWEEASQTFFSVDCTQCPDCDNLIFRLSMLTNHQEESRRHVFKRVVVYPREELPRPVPSEVGQEFAQDFLEACRVLPYSQKASAALSRRCLQRLLREKATVKPGSLGEEIREAINKSNFPGNLAQSLEAVRTIGNFAAHPIKNRHTGEVIDVEPGEAEWLLDTLEELFNFYFVQPAKMKRRLKGLNEKLDAAGKPRLT